MNSDIKELSKSISILANAHKEGCSKIAEALESISTQLKYLGNGNASTSMGAIEGMAMQIKDGLETIGSAIHEISDEMGSNRKA